MKRARGFSLVELVVVIVVLGILSGSVALFIDNPVRAYFDAQQRTALSGAADTALRRMARELQGALPNSVRVASAGSTVWLEFVPVADSGRYRTAVSAGAEPAGLDPLDFSNAADTGFQILGRPVTVPAAAQLVIFNLGAGSMDVYGGGNRRSVTSATGVATSIAFAPAGAWPAASPTSRFHLVTGPASFGCAPAADGSGVLTRYDGYAFMGAQPTSNAQLAGARRTVLVDGVVNCEFALDALLANANSVTINLVLGDATESVRLFHQVHLPNTP